MPLFVGYIEDVIHKKGDFQVVKFHVIERESGGKIKDTDELWSLVGNFMASVGDKVEVRGRLINKDHFGYYIQAERVKVIEDFTASEEQLHRFLTKQVKGIGPKMADALINRYGVEELIRLLDGCNTRIIEEVKGIGLKTAETIWESWSKGRFAWDPWKYLTGIGIRDLGHIRKIVAKYGRDTEEVVSKYPYKLLEINGLSFRTVDAIALKAGVDPQSKVRIMSAIMYILYRQKDYGHTYYKRDQLKGIIEYLLDLPELDDKLFVDSLYQLENKGKVVIEGDKVFSARLYAIERYVAHRLIELKYENVVKINSDEVTDFIQLYQSRHDVQFTRTQKRAIYQAANNGVMVLTGGPGTGKTFTVGALVELFRNYGYDVVLASPTGRSARRIKESTGYEARTIHRLLQVVPNDEGKMVFEHNERNPLDGDVFIIDEVSMVNLELMSNLLKAIPDGKKLILIGDKDQLPSIGVGNVLKDTIRSSRIPVVELQTVFRQSSASDIVLNALKVNSGKTDIVEGGRDFWWVKKFDEDLILRIVVKRIPIRFGIKPEDIKVITPYRREYANINVKQLNRRLQDIANPKREIEVKDFDGHTIKKPNEVVYNGIPFRVGDPVMQLENDYSKLVFNGDIGTVIMIDKDEDGRVALLVDFGDERGVKSYIESEISSLDLAYAMTIYKSQGSEFPAVVIVLPELNDKTEGMLKRNLLYTAITRAQKLCVLISSEESFVKCVRDNSYAERMTMLAEWLVEADKNMIKSRRLVSKFV